MFAPEGAGPNEAEGYINAIINSFAATTSIYWDIPNNALLAEDDAFITLEGGGRVLLDNVINVSIDYSERQQGMIDSPWYFTPINIGWYIYN